MLALSQVAMLRAVTANVLFRGHGLHNGWYRRSAHQPMAKLNAERDNGPGSPAELPAVSCPQRGLSFPITWD